MCVFTPEDKPESQHDKELERGKVREKAARETGCCDEADMEMRDRIGDTSNA